MNGIRGNPLDPSGDRERWEKLVRSITAAAAPELHRRRSRQELMAQFENWRRPVLSAAAVMILVFGSLFLSSLQGEQAAMGEQPLIVEAVLPNPMSLWLEMGTQPTLVEVVRAFEVERR